VSRRSLAARQRCTREILSHVMYKVYARLLHGIERLRGVWLSKGGVR